jgi:hypothetical protein
MRWLTPFLLLFLVGCSSFPQKPAILEKPKLQAPPLEQQLRNLPPQRALKSALPSIPLLIRLANAKL